MCRCVSRRLTPPPTTQHESMMCTLPDGDHDKPPLLKCFLLLVLLVAPSGCGGCDSNASSGPWDIGASTLDADASPSPDAVDVSDTMDDVAKDATPRDIDAAAETGLPPAMRYACSSDAGMGAGSGSCPMQRPASFGDCNQPLGFVFDGRRCVAVRGCPCTDDNCPAFETLEDCAKSCVADGWYQPENMPVTGPGQTASCPGAFCSGQVAFCSTAASDPTAQLDALMPAFDIHCVIQEEAGVCDLAHAPPRGDCAPTDWCCTLRKNNNALSESEYRQLCRMSLLPDVKPGGCYELE